METHDRAEAKEVYRRARDIIPEENRTGTFIVELLSDRHFLPDGNKKIRKARPLDRRFLQLSFTSIASTIFASIKTSLFVLE